MPNTKIVFSKHKNTKGQSPFQTLQALGMETGCLKTQSEMESVASALANDFKVTNGGHMPAGIVGVRYTLPALCKTGYCDIALNANLLRDYPSYGYWAENGATTLWGNTLYF